MRSLALRLLVLAALIGLYALKPLAGVLALTAGFAFVAAQRIGRRQHAAD